MAHELLSGLIRSYWFVSSGDDKPYYSKSWSCSDCSRTCLSLSTPPRSMVSVGVMRRPVRDAATAVRSRLPCTGAIRFQLPPLCQRLLAHNVLHVLHRSFRV